MRREDKEKFDKLAEMRKLFFETRHTPFQVSERDAFVIQMLLIELIEKVEVLTLPPR